MAQRESTRPLREDHDGNTESRFDAEAAAKQGRGGMDQETMQRAEEMVDRLAANIGSFVQRFGHQVVRLAARAREEAEDIWAEADSIRRRRQS
jgi:hypothetical protein